MGSAGSRRCVVRFVEELVALVRRAGGDGLITLRTDSGLWPWKLDDTLNRHGVLWSITVTQHETIVAAIATIAEDSPVDIDYTLGGRGEATETDYMFGWATGSARCASRDAGPARPANKPSRSPTGVTPPSSPTPPSMLSQRTSSTATTPSSS